MTFFGAFSGASFFASDLLCSGSGSGLRRPGLGRLGLGRLGLGRFGLGIFIVALTAFGLTGCNFGSEAAFTKGATLHPCDSDIPVCNTTAGCLMVQDSIFIEGNFPGYKQFIVPTERAGVIQVLMYWRTQRFPGADTEIIWHEPACIDSYSYQSQGVDIFTDSNSDGLFIKEMEVLRAGDHLIEVRSDATAEYMIRARYLTLEEWEDEQAAGVFSDVQFGADL